MIEKNVVTDFSSRASEPVIGSSTFVHPLAAVIGSVILGDNIMVSPGASIRGDEGQPLHVGNDSNVQDGVVIHALETRRRGLSSSWYHSSPSALSAARAISSGGIDS